MSKAFISESGGDSDIDDDIDDLDEVDVDQRDDKKQAHLGNKNYITRPGMDRLKAELHQLLAVERPKLVETVAWAASNGDRSENADYIYGKRRLREIDRRIRFLERRLDLAEVVDPATQTGEKVLFGATVTVRDESDAERIYRIVGIDETDAKNGKVSWISPVGQALLQASRGDTVTLKTPKSEEDLVILEVQYVAIN